MTMEEKILQEENEIKPNKRTADTMIFVLLGSAVLLLLTELNLFRVSKSIMRACLFMSIIASAAVQPFGRKVRYSGNPKTKYFMLFSTMLFCQIIMLVLGQFAELTLLYPIVISSQYHSRKLCWFVVVGTMIMAFVSAPASCLLGFTRVSYYSFLIEACGQSAALSALENYNPWEYAKLLVLFVSVPRMVIIGALSSVVFSIADLDMDNILNRIAATYYSSVDILTGIQNRFSFEKQVEEYTNNPPASLICFYADADGLHNLNNREGHMAGDAFLKACAEILQRQFGDKSYRIGGDEFLAFSETVELSEVQQRMEEMKAELERWNYHMSMGCADLKESGSVEELVKLAESRMAKEKKEYHLLHGDERE